jgi:2-polyprenyl-3-methyl-5-hydroxy-6-metoxy-1,4-benzoquinol methylase
MDDESALGTRHATDPDEGPAGEASHRYERTIDPESETTHGRVVQLVGRDHRVLELGPANGYMTAVMRDRGCTVVGIEFDEAMAAEAEAYAERMIVGDLDALDFDAELGDDRFDVIVAADVLEHLRDPVAVLQRLRPFLRPDGHLVVSLPNIAHGSVRLALLEGHFNYRETGLLDRTHLRFFTRENIDAMFDEAELAIAELYRQTLDVDASEIPFDRESIPGGVRELLARDPEARTYQFVLKAVPMAADGLREVQRRMRAMADEVTQLREQLADRDLEVAQLTNERVRELDRQAGDLRTALINAHDQLLRRDEQIQELQDDLDEMRGHLHAQREQEVRLRVRLDRILNSPPARAYNVIGELPFIRSLKNARAAGYRTAVQSARDAKRNG